MTQIPDGVDLRTSLSGDENMLLLFVNDRDVVGDCPLIEITPDGELIEQITNVTVEMNAIQALKEELKN